MERYAVKSGSRQSIENTRTAIYYRKPFKTSGALEGVSGNPGYIGRLNSTAREAYFRDANNIDYVVLSYSTPIAWHTSAGKWVVVGQKFSVTTTSHQSAVRQALMPVDVEYETVGAL